MDTRLPPGMTAVGDERLVRTFQEHDHRGMGAAFVYIMASGTTDLVRRVREHRTGAVAGFTKRYGVKTLVWFEAHDDIVAAIAREKALKH